MCDILNLEWNSDASRDRQMASTVCSYLRLNGLDVVEGAMHDGFGLIDKWKPKLLYLTNSGGAEINFEITKYAKFRGIKVVTGVSEGNFTKHNIEDFVWGWNNVAKLIEDYTLYWSKRSKQLTLNAFPELDSNRIKVSGGVGFDIYKFATLPCQKSFLSKYNKSTFQKVVGVGCWDFGLFISDEDTRYVGETEEAKRFVKDGEVFNEILLRLVMSHPEVLFLIKEHPGNVLGDRSSAIVGLRDLDNVLVLKNEEAVIDCISVSDFWIVYESTTAFEAWLLNKQTCLLNPSGIDFKREDTHKGSPFCTTFDEINHTVNEFYKGRGVPNFEKFRQHREHITEGLAQSDDGLNHVRFGNFIIDFIEGKYPSFPLDREIKRNWKLEAKEKLKARLHNWGIKDYLYLDEFNQKELDDFSNKRRQELLSFYKEQNLSKVELRTIPVDD